jgi:tRNA dimethylallyltransferase
MRDLLRGIDAERPVLIAGPTASGKSALAMEIAAARGGIVVNADALQVPSCWRVLTARPSVEDEAAVAHRLYGHVPGDTAYSVGAWLRDVATLLDGPRPIIVGGTGLYLTRLTTGLVDIPQVPPQVRADAAASPPELLLGEIDHETLARIDTANPARVRRAWEVLRATGRGLASWQRQTPPPLLPLDRAQPLVLEVDRDVLRERIARRADTILVEGAVDEVRLVLRHHGPDSPAMKAIGAPEIAAHITDHITLDDTRERLVAATRRYAKRQRTWFRSNMRDWTPIALA